MSKKNDKRKRNLEREKKHAKEAFWLIVPAVIFLILGVVGLIQNGNYLKEYEESEDIRTVEAVITDSKLKDDTAGERTWYAHLEYEIDGKTYNDGIYLFTWEADVGDKVKVEVYKRPNGKYVIPDVHDSGSLAIENIWMYISLVVGAGLMLGGMILLVPALRKMKEIKSKIQPDNQGNVD